MHSTSNEPVKMLLILLALTIVADTTPEVSGPLMLAGLVALACVVVYVFILKRR